MAGSPTAQLLETWERGLGLSPDLRIFALLGATPDKSPVSELATLTIGELDRRLFHLRGQIFGDRLNAITKCTACSEKLEITLNIADLELSPINEPPAPLVLERHGYRIEFRLPNGSDLLALDQHAGTPGNRLSLVQRCVLCAQREGVDIPVADLPDETVNAMGAEMAAADPQADIRIALQCPQCSRSWQVPLDISAFFWSELDAWAVQQLRDVHELALAYGWNETDILGLSPTRRRFYLEMIGK
jgi:hypothetical protein